ncbi:hypothetical protein ABZV34_39150, partial [Streptomyces sp. NPDC005195]
MRSVNSGSNGPYEQESSRAEPRSGPPVPPAPGPFGPRSAVVAGLGSSVPATVVSNDDLAAVLDTDDEWIRRRTGIRHRRV